MKISHIHFRTIERPLRIAFATSLGRKDVIRSVIVKVILENGTAGIGECPTSFVMKDETIPAIREVLRGAASELCGIPVEASDDKLLLLRKRYERFPMAVSGLETALFRASLAQQGISEHAFWGGLADHVETGITIPFVPGEPALDHWIDYALREGFHVFKVKVSGDVTNDMEFLSFLEERIVSSGKEIRIRLDGNQGYTLRGFLEMVDRISAAGFAVELFEQPLPKDDFRGLAEAARRSHLPIILDETIFTASDAKRAVDNGLGQGINIKVAKSGVAESRRIMEIALRHRMRLMIGCMMETMTGLRTAINMAAGTDRFDYIDLDSIRFLHHRKQYGDITIEGPEYRIGQGKHRARR